MQKKLFSSFLRVLCVVCGSLCIDNSADAQFVVHLDKPISPPLVGFGAEMNPYFYCKPNWPKDINEQNVGDYEKKVIDLAPQHLRIFCLNRWFFPMATTE